LGDNWPIVSRLSASHALHLIVKDTD